MTDRFRIMVSRREKCIKEAYLAPKHDPKKRGNTGGDDKWFGKTTFSKPTCIICEENHLFYKWESYKVMTRKEKMKFVKR